MRPLFALLVLLLAVLVIVVRADDEGSFGGGGDSEDPYGGGEGGGGGGYGGGGPGGYGGPGGGSGGSSREPKMLYGQTEIKSFIEEDAELPAIVGFFDVATNEADKETFMQVASQHGSTYRFAYVEDKATLEELKYDGCVVLVHKAPKFLAEKAGEKPKARYPSKSIKKDSLERFIFDKAVPMVGLKSFKTADIYDNLKIPLVTVFADVDLAKNPAGWKYISNRVQKAAKEAGSKFAFAVADKDDYSYTLDDFGISKLEGKQDIAVGMRVGNVGSEKSEMFYKMDTPFSADNLKAFVAAYKAGSLVGKEKTPYVPPKEPSDDFSDSVVTLTSDNFENEVTSTTADVLLDFYAPWCGHCKSLKPEYSQLADAFKGDAGIKIAAMDATAHTPPSTFEVKGYPTLYWLPAGSKKPVPYDGAREAAAMEAFIRENRST